MDMVEVAEIKLSFSSDGHLGVANGGTYVGVGGVVYYVAPPDSFSVMLCTGKGY